MTEAEALQRAKEAWSELMEILGLNPILVLRQSGERRIAAALCQAHRDGAGVMWALAARTWPSWDAFDSAATPLLSEGGPK